MWRQLAGDDNGVVARESSGSIVSRNEESQYNVGTEIITPVSQAPDCPPTHAATSGVGYIDKIAPLLNK